MRCDFCYSAGPIVGRLEASDFAMPVPGHWSWGDWAVCADCEDFVSARDWMGLALWVAGGVPTCDWWLAVVAFRELYGRLAEHAGAYLSCASHEVSA